MRREHGVLVHWFGQLECQLVLQLQQQLVVEVLRMGAGEEGRVAWLMEA